MDSAWSDGAIPDEESWQRILAYRTADPAEAQRLVDLGLTASDVATARYNLADTLEKGTYSLVAAAALADETAAFFQARLDQALDARSERVQALAASSPEWTYTAIGALLRVTKQRARLVVERRRRS